MKNRNSNVRKVKVRVKTVSDLEAALILKNLEGVEKSFGANLYTTMDTLDISSEIARLAGKKNQD